jgi:hypothetical protein
MCLSPVQLGITSGAGKSRSTAINNNERCTKLRRDLPIWSVCEHKADPEGGKTIQKKNNDLS